MTTRLVSRRTFVSSALASAAGLALGADRPARKVRYIDIHTHVGTFYWGRPLTPDGLVKLMDKHDVEKAVVLPLVSPESSPYPQTSEAALAAARAHPDRLIPFCAIDPRTTTGRPGADQLLFGTDFLMADQEVPHFELFDSLELPDEVQAKVYRRNAIRVLKLDGLK
jgi:predicted TIM-barrel fold metal-dependent hydrolase